MFIKMIETRQVCDDGFVVRQLHAGDTYELCHSTGTMIVRQGWGREVEGDAAEKPGAASFATVFEALAEANIASSRMFRPQPTRGCGSTNPATLAAKGIDV